MKRRYEALPPTLPPRGLCREAAASYIGVSASKFDEMVEDGRMPPAKRIDARKVWDRSSLDASFDLLPSAGDQDVNPWDSVVVGPVTAAA